MLLVVVVAVGVVVVVVVVRLVWLFMVVGILYRGNSRTRIRRHELDGWSWVVFLDMFLRAGGTAEARGVRDGKGVPGGFGLHRKK